MFRETIVELTKDIESIKSRVENLKETVIKVDDPKWESLKRTLVEMQRQIIAKGKNDLLEKSNAQIIRQAKCEVIDYILMVMEEKERNL